MNSDRFRLVYSQCLGMFVPVSETTKAQGRKSSGKRMRSRYAVAAALFSISYTYDAIAAPPDVNALPTNGVVNSGNAVINAAIYNPKTNITEQVINQTTKNAIINWGTFNIGANASLNFVQPNSTSAVLNRVTGPNVNGVKNLSQIYGNLTANGQVYLINPNGILFGSSAQVNVNSLVASSLNISDDLFNKGYLSITNGDAAFSGTTGYIQVNAGAEINAATGGKVLMFAPDIKNNGLIKTSDGQTLLAAGQKIYLTASDDPNLRGLLVEVDNGGNVNNGFTELDENNKPIDGKVNVGQIIAERGNITLAGIAVNQNGRVKATTSVTANGSIKLQAQDTAELIFDAQAKSVREATKAGDVVLGENSITEVLLDATDKASVLDSSTVNKSKVDISGQSIHLMNNAMIIAPSGNVSLVAGLNPSVPTILDSSSSAIANSSRIYFENGSGIDVSGVGSGSTAVDRVGETAAQLSVASNVVQAELRSTQLRDSPLQRDGILNKAKVYVDARAVGVDGNVGTSVADVSGYTSAIQHGIKERLAAGGTVKVQSEGDIVYAPTATINVSGGKVDYTSGTVTKTRLLASNGQTYDIANAPKDLKYVAIQNVSVQEQGYTTGKDAGSVSFSAPAMVLEGKLKGDTIAGIRQRTNLTKPKGATLQIGQNKANPTDIELLKQTYVLHSDLLLDASHTAGALPTFNGALSKLSPEQQQTLLLGSNFTAPTGFNSLLYYSDGQITLKNGTNLGVSPGGNITLNGGGVDVQGNITARSGTVDLSAKERVGYIGKQATFTNNANSNVVVGSASNLDVSGLWTNDRLNLAATDMVAVDGGKINISASSESGAGNITLEKGSLVNASGGGWLNTSGKLSGGKGGDIKLLASEGIPDSNSNSHTGKLKLDGTLRADSIAAGGSLSLSSGTVTIGASALGTTGETLIAPTLFQNGGFTSYNINGFEGLTLAKNTTIAPAALTRVLDSGFSIQQSGANITKFSHLSMLPATNAALTRKVTNLSLSATNQNSGRLSLDLDSKIIADPGANVSLLGKRQLTVLGTILAPAGNISMTSGLVTGEKSALTYRNDQTLWLGAKSVLDVSGITDSYTNANGFKVGTVKDAGSIKLNATKGEVVAEAGSQLKLNGTHTVLNVKSGNSYVAKDVASKGGNLAISAREGILLDATMSAHGGNESVVAGSLSIALPFLDIDAVNSTNSEITNPIEQYPTGPREIVLKATGSAVPVGLRAGDAIDVANNGLAYVYADKLQSAGFDSVQLAKSDTIRIAENVNLTTRGAITLDTPNLLVNDGVNAVITSSYVGIGNSQVLTQDVLNKHLLPAVAGTGVLTVNADYIDLFGQQSLSGVSKKDPLNPTKISGANFNSAGDIQLRGVLRGFVTGDATINTPIGQLQTAGDLSLSARRIYPSTISEYTLSSIGDGATIAFKSNGADTGVPYSVLGTLNVEAANITQDGVLRAPLGEINLKASDKLTLGAGSLTSVSAEGKTLPFGYTINGKDWSFDVGNNRIATISSLPDKAVNLDGKVVSVEGATTTKSASKIDISGGGDLSAWEFTTGTGGSDDVLAADGVFAVLPNLKAGYMAGNSESYSNSTFKAGDSIYLSGGNGLAAGNYVLLPAHYALLPGGYSVKAVAGTQDFVAQQNTLNKDGSMLVSGYRTQFGGITADSRNSGFLVASGNIARTQSEFTNTTASKFFNKTDSTTQLTNLRLPADAGRVAINAISNLILDGDLVANHAAQTRGAAVDISSDKIAVTGDSTQKGDSGYLTLSSTKLNSYGAESLTIGGKRTSVAEGTLLDVTASNVKLIGGASLTGQEITLAATDTVSMAADTSVKATGAATKNNGALIIGNETAGSGDGALLRVSTGGQPDLVRKNVTQANGTLDIQTLAKVSGTSVIADATKANSVNGEIALAKDGAIRLGAPKISFGATTAAVTGLQLDNSKLEALGDPGNIQLKSYSTIDFYGTTAVGKANLKSLTLESSGLVGYGNADNTVTLTADTVKFSNPDGKAFAPTGVLGTGTLAVNATKEIGLGNGTFSTVGFSTVNLKADQVIGEAKGTLDVKGDINIDAGRITAAGLSDQTIKASGELVTKQHTVTGLAAAPLGGKLTLAADTITHGGIIDLPSGVVSLKAAGTAVVAGGNSLILLKDSQINARGSAQLLGTVAALADAGTINLQTANGNISMKEGAIIDVSATGGAAAGAVVINTPGTANLAGTLNGLAAAGNGVGLPKQGSIEILAKNLTNFAALNSELERGQFNQNRNIHVEQGDITVAATDKVTAHNVTLTTDDGNLTVAGTIDASGDKGGIVNLNAGQLTGENKGNITLASTAKIDASATTAATETAGSTGDGGKVILNTATNSDTSPATGSSSISAEILSEINVSGKGLGSDGKVTLRAPRLGMASATDAGNGIAVTQFGATVNGVNAKIVAEGVKVYKNIGTEPDVILDSTTMLDQNASYLANANTKAIASNLGFGSDARFVVASGDEVRSTGNIDVANAINLQADGPGALTLRAKGDVNVNGNISAGFTTPETAGVLTTGGTWTYRIAAGADLNSADVLATNNAGTGNFTLAANKLIRTGTGDIDIATGGDFSLASAGSVIYTAGELDTKDYKSTLGNFTDPTVIKAAYTINGGDISLTSKGNINGAYTAQLPADWLFRQGRVDGITGKYTANTSWWTYFNNFKENIGALSGGDININAGGAINDLSAVIATNGRVYGAGPADGKLVQNGGGDLTVKAGADISGGLYMVDKGAGTIRAGGGLIADAKDINTVFALGDAALNVATLGQLNLMTVFNPTLTGMSRINVPTIPLQNSISSVFSTYGENSAVQLTSLASGVEITNQLAANDLVLPNANDPLRLFPGTLNVAALGGDFTVVEGRGFTLIPTSQGNLRLAASGSINLNAAINMSDKDPAQIPSVLKPISTQAFANVLPSIKTTSTSNTSIYHAATLLHAGDSEPIVIFAGKDIVGNGTYSLFLPKKANVVAGNDINNFAIFGQNLNAEDVTTISAGNDYSVGINGVSWGGPGYLDISAGRNVNLGVSDGIVTRGNLDNPFLPEAGANLSVLVGAKGADDQAFIAKYLDPAKDKSYSSNLTSFVKKVTGNTSLSDAEAWAEFQTMEAQLQHQFVQNTFFNELKQAGVEHNKSTGPNSGSYKRGFDAIATYFPNASYDGKLDLAFSQLKTERGGDLNVMAPGGSIVIGLPKIPETLLTTKAAKATNPESILGIFTVKGGNINLFSKGNIDVAQSREFTIAGGDILNWSSEGDIDAGKGSKTATSAPPPLIRTDKDGNTVVDLSGVVSGSGIGTLQTLPDVPPGDVTLIAPSGAVNAGDAGIRSSGNLLVAAQRVIGADNISVGGTSSGVPAVTTVNISFNAPASADSAANNKQGDQLGSADKLGENSKLAKLLSLISVEVLSLGDE